MAFVVGAAGLVGTSLRRSAPRLPALLSLSGQLAAVLHEGLPRSSLGRRPRLPGARGACRPLAPLLGGGPLGGRSASSSAAASGTSAPEIPDIMFEDILAMSALDFEGDGDEDGQAKGDGRGRRQAPEKKPAPFSDDELVHIDVAALPRDQLIWAIGRAANRKMADRTLWQSFGKAIARIGETQLLPTELCKLVQAFAYAPVEVPLDERQLQRLLKAFAAQSERYNDHRLMRVIYGYTKLAAKRDFALTRFLDFVTSEVVERRSMKPWRKLWILRAVAHLPDVAVDFRGMLVSDIMRGAKDLDAASFADFVPMLVEHRIHERRGVVGTLNARFKHKVFNYKMPDLLLQAGLPMLQQDLMKTVTIGLWLSRLHELRLPITAAMAAVAEPLPGGRDEVGPPTEAVWARRATDNLERLKRVELCLRHERDPVVVAALPLKARHLLTVAQQTPLQPPDDYSMLELPFVFGELSVLLRKLGILLHPTIFGPYLLELADPLGRIVVEWDTTWVLYPPYRQKSHKDFVQRKHLHLRAEGWQVVCLPLAEFRALERGQRLEWVRRAAEARSLSSPEPLASRGSQQPVGDAVP